MIYYLKDIETLINNSHIILTKWRCNNFIKSIFKIILKDLMKETSGKVMKSLYKFYVYRFCNYLNIDFRILI